MPVALGNTRDLARAFRGSHYDAVMQFAAYSRVEESVREPVKYFRNNITSNK